jgi:hypothetical protein
MGQLDSTCTGAPPESVVRRRRGRGALQLHVQEERVGAQRDVAVQVEFEFEAANFETKTSRNQEIMFQVQGLKPGAFKLWVKRIQVVQPPP